MLDNGGRWLCDDSQFTADDTQEARRQSEIDRLELLCSESISEYEAAKLRYDTSFATRGKSGGKDSAFGRFLQVVTTRGTAFIVPFLASVMIGGWADRQSCPFYVLTGAAIGLLLACRVRTS